MMGATHKETLQCSNKNLHHEEKQTNHYQSNKTTNPPNSPNYYKGNYHKWFAGSSLEIRLSKNDITGRIAYQSTLQTLQKWELCTLGTTFLVSAQALSKDPNNQQLRKQIET